MAPIYLAATVPTSNAPAPLFALKGLKGLAPAALGSLSVVGVPICREIAYDAYRANMDAFLAATIRKERIFCCLDGFGFLQSEGGLPLPEPGMAFVLAKPVAEEIENKIVAKLGEGSRKEKSGKTTVFIGFKVTEETLNFAISVSQPGFNYGKDFVSPIGLRALRLLCGYVAEFLRVNTYPAFRLKKDEEYPGMVNWGCFDGEAFGYDDIPDDIGKKEYARTVISAARVKRSFELEASGATVMDVDEDDNFREFYGKIDDIQGKFETSLHDAVYTAKPSPAPLGANIVNPNELAEIPGLVFPYFKGLCVADSGVIKKAFGTVFLRLLGSNIDQVKAKLQELRRGMQSLATTDAGLALTHILTGINLCLETQTKLSLVFDGPTYNGFTLQGTGFSIFDGTKWSSALPVEGFRADLESMDPHRKAVGEIIRFLERMRLEGGYPADEHIPTEEEVNDPKQLVERLRKLNFKDLEKKDDEEKEVNRIIRSLNFRGEGYLDLNPQNVLDFLTLFFDTNVETELSIPTFLPAWNAPFHTRAFHLLSKFGPDAPSLWDPKGQEFPCKAAEIAGDAKGKKRAATEKNVMGLAPEAIIISPKPLMTACNDMQLLCQKGAVKFNLKERAKAHRAITTRDKSWVEKFWTLLVGAVEGGAGEGPKKKKGKGKEVATVDFDTALGAFLS